MNNNNPQEWPRCKRCQAWKNGTTHPRHDCTKKTRRQWIAHMLGSIYTLSEIKKAVRFYEID